MRILLGLAPDDPTDTVELARQLRARGVGNLIVTMGEKGALILTEDGLEAVAGVPVDVVDTTGAGDAFNAGLAVALAEGKSLAEAASLCQPLRRVRLSEAGCGSCIGDTGDGWIVVLGFWFLGLVDVC